MNIQTRILIGYGYLLVLLVLAAGGAALGFHQLGQAIGRVMVDNYDSVRSSMDLLQALERQDKAVLAVLLGHEERRNLLVESEWDFDSALHRARENITLEGEEELVAAVADRFGAFRTARDRLLANPPAKPLQAYNEETFPRFDETREAVVALLDANHHAMIQADESAREQAGQRALLLGLLVTVALLSAGFLSRQMRINVLDRLTELAEVSRAIAQGDRARRAPAYQNDELGLVARQLNAALDSEQEIEHQMRGRLAQQRQLLLGLLAEWSEPAAIVTLTGNLVASSLDDAERKLVERTARHLVEEPAVRPGAAVSPEERTVRENDSTVRFRLIETPTKMCVGWLATIESPTAGND